jgi:hypothetical protein
MKKPTTIKQPIFDFDIIINKLIKSINANVDQRNNTKEIERITNILSEIIPLEEKIKNIEKIIQELQQNKKSELNANQTKLLTTLQKIQEILANNLALSKFYQFASTPKFKLPNPAKLLTFSSILRKKRKDKLEKEDNEMEMEMKMEMKLKQGEDDQNDPTKKTWPPHYR